MKVLVANGASPVGEDLVDALLREGVSLEAAGDALGRLEDLEAGDGCELELDERKGVLRRLAGGSAGFFTLVLVGAKEDGAGIEHAVLKKAKSLVALDAGARPRALVVDDTEISVEIGKRVLERLGYEAEGASSGEEALRRVGRADYSLVLMDLQMPGTDGFVSARKLLAQLAEARRPAPRILGMSATVTPAEKKLAIEAGMLRVMAKPLVLGAVRQALSEEASLDGETWEDEGLRRRLVGMLLEQAPSDLERMEASLAIGDRAELRARAHALKGGADVVGALPLSRTCERLQSVGIECLELAELKEMVDAARAAFAAFKSAVKEQGYVVV